MPTYEYVCKSCGDHLEVVQAFTDESLTVCTACGGPLRKVFGSIGISFKGSGFYRTDSRPAATKRDKDHEKAAERDKDKSAATGKEGASAKNGSSADGASTSPGSSSSKSDSSPPAKSDSSSPTSSESKPKSGRSDSSGGPDKARATTSPG